MPHLIKLLRNHGKSFEDDLRGTSDGDDSFCAGAIRNINACSTLLKKKAYTSILIFILTCLGHVFCNSAMYNVFIFSHSL